MATTGEQQYMAGYNAGRTIALTTGSVDAGRHWLTEHRVRSVNRSLEAYGAEILVQDLPARVLEGSRDGFVTLLRFADLRAAQRWYDSSDYQSIRHLRVDSSSPTCILVEGVRPGHRSADLAQLFGRDDRARPSLPS